MIIDDQTYTLGENNYIPVECIKKQIVIGNTFNRDMKHFIGWKKRYNGEYKKTAAFTISSSGAVYQHFDPSFQSKYFDNLEQNTKSIVILLENYGWLEFDEQKNSYNSFFGDIYIKPNQVFDKKWRGFSHWEPYTKEQFDSCVKLVDMLCEEFFIPKVAMAHNTKLEDISDFNGVLYKSNIEKHYTDISPAWFFDEFKNKLEIK